MKIYNRPRRTGKTMRMLYASEFNNVPILCSSTRQKEFLIKQAKMYDIDIPKPLTIETLNGFNGDKILIDEVLDVLACLVNRAASKPLEIQGITLTEPDRDYYSRQF